MYQYPDEWKKYKSAREYQLLATKILRQIFDPQMVKPEWDASKFAFHGHSHGYSPRTDIAIGPFNSGADIDIGNDRTWVMKNNPLCKKLIERKEAMGWNKFSRCFLAIEIVFSGSSKHILGDLANASWIGSIGFVVARSGEPYRKANRMTHYFYSNSGSDPRPIKDQLNARNFYEGGGRLDNLIVFQDDDFLQFLWELLYPEKERRLLADKGYAVSYKGFWGEKTFYIRASTSKMKTEAEPSPKDQKKFLMFGVEVDKIIDAQEVHLLSPGYIVNTTSAFVWEISTKAGEVVKIMEILDIATQPNYCNKGIEAQVMEIFIQIAQKNRCKLIISDLPEDSPREPMGSAIEFFKKMGFDVWEDKGGRFSGWIAKASMKA